MFLFQILLLCLHGNKQDNVSMCLFCHVIAEGGSAYEGFLQSVTGAKYTWMLYLRAMLFY